jgi:VIT1/CCC1 family predicted Fe2+/Mn2+ transporter
MARGLQEAGLRLPRHKVSTQTKILKFLARVFGANMVYPLLQSGEIGGGADYAAQSETTAALAPEERMHARTLAQLSGQRRGAMGRHGEHWHRSGGGGTLRAMVFGVSDGLVSNLSLVMGFAGAATSGDFMILAGLSGLLAGASSMAAGEYVSMQAQRELFQRQIELEAAELAVSPQEEKEELALIYRAKGLPQGEAESIASRLLQDPNVALDSLVREELGLDPEELGWPVGAAIASFLAFAFGAFLPVVPYFFGDGTTNMVASIALSGIALFGVGALLSVFTGRAVLFSGGRQLVIGAVAATLTYAIGSLIGASTGI